MRGRKSRKKNKTQPWKRQYSFTILPTVFSALALGLFVILIYLVKQHPTPICANSISCIKDLSGAPTNASAGVFMGKKIAVPRDLVTNLKTPTSVLGITSDSSDLKRIYVDLTNQRLYAFEGQNLVFNFPVSTGWWNKTPTGTYRIWIKLTATRMVGGSGVDAYDLPNVPWTMYFYNNEVPKTAGYSLHGAYWHHRFGHPMSHGCVNIDPQEAKQLYDWTNPITTGFTTYSSQSDPGTLVTIYGATPDDPPVFQ